MDKYVAYVSTYTVDNDWGIRIYDADLKEGRLTERDHISITNSSYLTIAHNGKFIYSITDMGVESFKVLKGGGLEPLNKA